MIVMTVIIKMKMKIILLHLDNHKNASKKGIRSRFYLYVKASSLVLNQDFKSLMY